MYGSHKQKEGRDEIGVAVYTVLRKAEWSIIWEIKERKITDSGRKIFKGTVVFYWILDND